MRTPLPSELTSLVDLLIEVRASQGLICEMEEIVLLSLVFSLVNLAEQARIVVASKHGV
jgi:hypothetical protein